MSEQQSDKQERAQKVEISNGALFRQVRQASAWIMLISAVLFAFMSIMAIWGVFGDTSETIWRSLSSLAVIAFASLVANVAARSAGTSR